jgi:outer membrane protein assembly factor BamB
MFTASFLPKSFPVWPLLSCVRLVALLLVATVVPVSLVAQELTVPKTAAGDQWLLPRGDAQSTGRAKQTLPDNLAMRWEYQADEAIETSPVVGLDTVFVADVLGKIYAVDRGNGQERWTRNYDTGFLASPAIQNEMVFIGDIEGNLYALDARTGEERWKQTTEGEINGAVGFYDDSVLVTSQDGKLYCFAIADGSPRWTYQTEDQIRCSPTVAEGRTFLGGCDGQLHVVDLKTGMAVGKPLPLGGPTGSTPAVLGSKAFVPIMDGVVLALDWRQPSELWTHEDAQRPQEYRSSAAVSDELVIVSSQNKQVDALSIETGEQKWRYTLRRRADASPVIAGQDVWIAATDGRLIRLSLAEGKEKWTYEIRGSFLAGPAIAGNELYIADDDGILRCFAKP